MQKWNQKDLPWELFGQPLKVYYTMCELCNIPWGVSEEEYLTTPGWFLCESCEDYTSPENF